MTLLADMPVGQHYVNSILLSAKPTVDQNVLLIRDFDWSANKACRPIHSKYGLSAYMDSAKSAIGQDSIGQSTPHRKLQLYRGKL